ncbi:MAG: hypothetical protein J1G02_00415 [Clostridiales bacterium]|nr:hypothetical protein [Clostridiales bacterium]
MNKLNALLGDVAVTVGCCIGVGFLSGKEAQVFFGNVFNVAIFAVVFFVANLALREYCRMHRCDTVGRLSSSLFGKVSKVCNVGIALCSFVCIVTVLAGVEQCLSSMFYLSKLPLYAFVTALIATLLLRRDIKALKYANFVAIVMAVILIILLCHNSHECVDNLQVPIYQPIIYALFSITMSLGVTTQLAGKASRNHNVLSAAIASVIVASMMIVMLRLSNSNVQLPALNNITSPILLAYAVVTLLLSAVTGIVANAYPIVQELKSLITDDTVCNALIFGTALAFSMFGFDFAVKFGYMLVSAFGLAVVVLIIFKMIIKRNKSRIST